MKFTHKKLNNGLNVFTVPIPDADSVIFTALVKVGGRYESKDTLGTAHFLEHVFFKGSRNFPKPTSITSAIDQIGGDMNALTYKELTEFYIRAEKHNFKMVFETLTDMLLNPLFKEQELEKEKGVVFEEMNQMYDNPGAYVDSILDKMIWPNSSLGEDILGTKETVGALNRKKVFGFKEKFYQPQNMILGVGGSFDEQEVWKMINKTWGKLKSKKTPAMPKLRETQKKPQLRVEYKDTKQGHLALAFRSFGHRNKSNSAAFLLAGILGGSTSSRLWVNIREQNGLAYYIRAADITYSDTGEFTIQAGLRVEKTLDALKQILAEIRKVKSDLVSDAELRRAKNYVKGRIALALENNHEKLSWILERFVYEGKPLLPQDLFDKLDKVTPEQIRDIANKIFRNERMNLAIVGPFKNAKLFEKELHLKGNF